MDALLELRHRVFCVEQGVPEHEEIDGRDGEAIHLVALRDGELLGTCRLLSSTAPCSSAGWPSSRTRAGGGSRPRCWT